MSGGIVMGPLGSGFNSGFVQSIRSKLSVKIDSHGNEVNHRRIACNGIVHAASSSFIPPPAIAITTGLMQPV